MSAKITLVLHIHMMDKRQSSIRVSKDGVYREDDTKLNPFLPAKLVKVERIEGGFDKAKITMPVWLAKDRGLI